MRRNGESRITLALAVMALIAALAALSACSASNRDATITGQVKTVLQADRVVDASKIQVSTEEGVVTLDGSVAGETAHRKAVELAERVDGVRQVRDRLSVTAAPPPAPDAEVPASPAGRNGAEGLGGMTVENWRRSRPKASQPGGSYGMLAAVVGPQGDVSLAPEVESVEPVARRESSAAGEVRAKGASAVSFGEETISSSLPDSPVPLGPSDAEDAAITARVQAALVELGHRVQVLTRAGVVILSGAVDTELERIQALRIAKATKGVARVEDRLIVLVT